MKNWGRFWVKRSWIEVLTWHLPPNNWGKPRKKKQGQIKGPSVRDNHWKEAQWEYCWLISFYHDATALVDQTLLFIDASRSYSDTPHLIRLLWTSDQPDIQNSTWQHKTITRDRHPCPRWESNPQFQQANGRRPTLQTARSLGSALSHFGLLNWQYINGESTIYHPVA